MQGDLQAMVQKGYVKEWKARLRNQFEGTEEQQKQEIRKRAATSTQEWTLAFESELKL